MCGIIGYIGTKEALPILIDGLKNLEYRGYDSAGIIVSGRSIHVHKATGRVSNLEKKLSDAPPIEGSVGVAHTRWATHGVVSEQNAHPHADCDGKIFVVHNGIIENYKELKGELMKRAHRFRSETDSEVLAHLIEEQHKEGATVLEDAVRRALKKIHGTYGLVVFSSYEPHKIVAARNFSPLILGVGTDEFIIASDATAIVRLTNNVLYIKDGEIVSLTPAGYRIFTIDNENVHRASETLEWDMSSAQKGGYPHFMLKEISEQPEAIENSIRGRLVLNEGKARLGGLEEAEKIIRSARRLIIAACGSAYCAAKIGEYMLEEYAGIPTEVDFASEFRYRKPVFEKGDIFLAISQSGETADTLGAMREAKEKGVPTFGIVNVVGSTLSRETDAGVYQHVGPEIGVATTKAFVSQVAILALFTIYIGRKRNLSMVMGRRIAEELQRIPNLMKKILKKSNELSKLAEIYQPHQNFLYLGRKYNYPIALEGAIKLKELSYVHAEGCSAGEMKHGPIAMIDQNFPVVAIAPQDSVYEKMISNIEEIKARKGLVLAIATEGDKKIKQLADDVFYIPKTLEMLSPLLTVIPLQLFAYHFAAIRGLDVDKPRNLAKSVTVE